MSVFKSSNASPSLSEIDLTETNTFSAQANTSGEPIKAYKMSIFSGDAADTIYEGTIQNLTTPVKNKAMLSIPINVAAVGTTYYSNTSLTTVAGTLTTATVYVVTSTSYSTITLNDTNYYIATPSTYKASFVNGKDYQWGIRTYNTTSSATTQPNTLVCSGYTVGSTKYVVWCRIDDHGEGGANQDLADNIVYDRYIEFSVDSADKLLIGGHEPDTKEKPTGISSANPYIQRKKIEWVDKQLGTDEDFIKIEAEEAFDYDYIDGTSFTIYQCSSDHTVNSAFADPNSNINVANYVLIYASPAAALTAFNNGEKPGSGTTTALYGGSKKITGYSSDTGEIRVHDAWTSAPVNGNAYRVFEQDVSTKQYTEIFASNVSFTAASGKTYYGTTIYATSSSTVPYYSDKTLSTKAGDLITSTSCEFATSTYSTITRGSTVFYVATPSGGTLSKAYDAVNINGVYGNVIIDSVTYAVAYGDLTPKIKDVATSNPFLAQVIGGTPISDSAYVTTSNRWGSTDSVKRLFIQPNINIKTDDTNPNEIVFTSTGGRLDIIKQTTINSTTGKTIDITFNKLDNSQWLLEGAAIGNLVGTLPLITVGSATYINPQTDYKVYTDFMDSAPLNLFYARLTPTMTIQCRSYYETLKAQQGQTFPVTSDYYVPQYTTYYKTPACNDLASGDSVYLPKGEAYYESYSVGEGFENKVGELANAITEIDPTGSDYPRAIYSTSVCSQVQLTAGGTIYYAHTPSYKATADTTCTWDVSTELDYGIILDKYDNTRYVKKASIRENPSIYMDMPSVLYMQTIKGKQIPVYDYRDFEFNTNVTFTNDQQVKYYNYQLYVKTTNGWELIGESEDIYSIYVEWHFRGFERGEKTSPQQYKVVVNVVDNYDREFSAEEIFGIYYAIEETVVPLDINYDCHEKGITISVRDPLFVKTTNLSEDLTTVTTDNLVDVGGEVQYMYISDDQVLNYTNVNNDEETPIYIPAQSALLTQFQIRGDFIETIEDGGEVTVLQLTNEFTETEFQACVDAGKAYFANSYNNNVDYSDILSHVTYTPSTPTAEIPCIIVMLPGYYQALVAKADDEIFIKGTDGIYSYASTSWDDPQEITTDTYASYVDSTYSTIGDTSVRRYVRNEDPTYNTNLYNVIIRYNRLDGTTTPSSILSDSEVQSYFDALLSGIGSAPTLSLLQAADANSKQLMYAMIPLTSTTRYSQTVEDTNKAEIKYYLNNLYHIAAENESSERTFGTDTAYLDTYTLTLGDTQTYYKDSEGTVHKNEHPGSLRMYRNDDLLNPLICFDVDDTMLDYYSIEDNCGPGIVPIKTIRYALQKAEGFEFCIDRLPVTGSAGTKYVLMNDFVRSGTEYVAGVYTYSDSTWNLDLNNEYMVVRSSADLPSDITQPASISNAAGVYDATNDKFIWLDTDTAGNTTAWIENTASGKEKSKESFDNLWLTLYAIWDYEATNPLVCTFQYSKGGKL